MKSKKRKTNFLMYIVCILFDLTLISFHLTSGLYAKYSKAQLSNTSSRVAVFDITQQTTYSEKELILHLVPGEYSAEVEIRNNSEVMVDYEVTIQRHTYNIPFGFEVDGEKYNDQYIINRSVQANAMDVIKMQITWEQEGALEYMGMVDLFHISIEAVQMD